MGAGLGMAWEVSRGILDRITVIVHAAADTRIQALLFRASPGTRFCA
jgi:hypothetical protein